jgi:uncharacterized membrane protein YqiK
MRNLARNIIPLQSKKIFIKIYSGFGNAKKSGMGLQIIHTGWAGIGLSIFSRF